MEELKDRIAKLNTRELEDELLNAINYYNPYDILDILLKIKSNFIPYQQIQLFEEYGVTFDYRHGIIEKLLSYNPNKTVLEYLLTNYAYDAEKILLDHMRYPSPTTITCLLKHKIINNEILILIVRYNYREMNVKTVI